MAVATTPYQQNDYQSANTFRPYRLPVEDIMKANTAINAYWDAGAAKVKGVYDNAVDLQLSLEPNIQLRDQYLKDAQVQLQKLSSMDLSDPNVQRQGVGIFKPLFSDEGIMSDDQSTRTIAKINSDALSFRNKDEGKGYSVLNHQYALTGANEFKNSKDRMAGKEYLKNAKTYEPYYNPKSEIDAVLKMCKPDKVSNQVTQGYSLRTFTDESLTAAKINTCLDAGLSDPAKRQIQINGAITYRNQPEALRDKFLPHLQGTRAQLAENKAAIQGVLANKDNLKNLKKEDLAKIGITDVSQITPEFIKSLEEKVINIEGRMTNINRTVSKLQANDFSPIMGAEFETVAGTVYSRDYMQNIAEGFSYDFQTNTKELDAEQKMFFDAYQTNARQEDDQQHDELMQDKQNQADLFEKMMTGKGPKGTEFLLNPDIVSAGRIQNATDNAFSTINVPDTYDTLTAKRAELANQKNQVYATMTNEARLYKMPTNISLGTPEGEQWFHNFETTAKGDPEKMAFVNRYRKQIATISNFNDAYKHMQDNADATIAPELNAAKDKITNIPPITVDGVTITGQDILNAVSGKASPLKIVKPAGGNIVNPYTGRVSQESPKFYYNGQEIIPRYGMPGFELEGVVYQADKLNKESVSKLRKVRDQVIGETTVEQKEGYLFSQLNEKDNQTKQRIMQELEIAPKYADKLIIGQTDLNGNLIVTISPQGKGEEDYNPTRAIKKAKNYGGRDNQMVPGREDQIVLQGVQGLTAVDDRSITRILPPYMKSLEKTATREGTATSTYFHSQSGRQYGITIYKGVNGGHTYKIIDSEAPLAPIASYESHQEALQRLDTLIKK